jgi:hypothetical protein
LVDRRLGLRVKTLNRNGANSGPGKHGQCDCKVVSHDSSP